MKAARGFTLIELMVSGGIMLVAVAAATLLFLEGGRLVRRGEEIVGANDKSRLAMESVMNRLQHAGMGAPDGLYVNIGGAVVLVNAVYGSDGTGPGGSDELWLVVPHRNAMREAGVDAGAATSLTSSGTGVISVNRTSSLAGFPFLMVTNMKTAALLTTPVLTAPSGLTPGSISYAESGVTGFSNAPQKGGYQVGDLVYPVTALHYHLLEATTGTRSLVQEVGTLNPNLGQAPFVATATSTEVQTDVEDFQVAWGIDATNGPPNPANITWSTASRSHVFSAGLRSLRISVVAVSRRTILDGRGKPMATSEYAPMAVEGNTPAGAADGRRRTLYSRRVELMNLAPAAL